jgi:hypothetical protein
MFKRIILAVALFLTLNSYVLAQEPVCMQRQDMIDFLYEDYGEERTWQGADGENTFVVEVFTNEETGTWTVVSTGVSDNQSCMRASGSGFKWITDGERLNDHSQDG